MTVVSRKLEAFIEIVRKLEPPELDLLQRLAEKPQTLGYSEIPSKLTEGNLELVEQTTRGEWQISWRGKVVLWLAKVLNEVDIGLHATLLLLKFQEMREQLDLVASVMGEHHPSYDLIWPVREAEQAYSAALIELRKAVGGLKPPSPQT